VPKREQTLQRLLRVRTLQLGLTRADESRAQQRLASENALRARIAELAEGVAPTQSAENAFSFIAAAHYRERLHQSAHSALTRVSTAQRGVDAASQASRDAKRDQSAIEKLLARAEADAALKAIRAMEEVPPVRKVRHDPC